MALVSEGTMNTGLAEAKARKKPAARVELAAFRFLDLKV